MAYIVFLTPVGYRLYDREKNKIIPLRDNEYQAVAAFCAGCSVTEQQESVMKRLKDAGYCHESELEDIQHPQIPVLHTYLSQKLGNLVLQVTQNCNLRCEYCSFSGNYFNRVHNQHRMSEEIALQAVDFFMERSGAIEHPIIGFYGGEPFLEFALIKKVVRYVKDKYPDRNCGFNLTTNLTLLNDEIMRFIVDNNFDIMISIDGPQPAQDRYRVFVDGRGSFATVMDKAKKLKEFDISYFEKCHTNTVVSPGADYEQIADFFDHDEIFGPLSSRISVISDVGIKEKIVYDKDFFKIQKRETFKLFLAMLGEVDQTNVSNVYTDQKANILKAYTQLKSSGTSGTKRAHPGGPCIPGAKKLFVDIHGKFYPCEKGTEEDWFCIGNLWDGIDEVRVANFLNVGQYTADECKKCWAFSFCTTCAVSMIEKKGLSRNMRLERCKEVHSNIFSTLQDLETLKYYGYDFEEEGINK